MSTEATARKRRAAESGILRFDGALITYASQHYGSFSIPISEVAVIGEFTTDNGPFIDDWFLVLVHRGGQWFEASIYAEGIDSFLMELSATLSSSIVGSLAASTDFSDRIIWPARLAGRPLFTSNPVTDSGFLRRIKLSMFREVSHSLSPDALSAIENGAAGTGTKR